MSDRKKGEQAVGRVSDPATQGVLYIVPVPIGNLMDITYRAVDVLRTVSVIAAEDTRNFFRLQREYDIRKRVVSYHDFNEQQRSKWIVDRLLGGESVALVSDAGTPLVSDPGFRVVRAAVEAGVRVVSLPGACAAVTALVASGFPLNQFKFIGFPPRTASRRRALFGGLRSETATLIFYESPHRLIATLSDLQVELGDREATLARNLTKPDETYQRGSIKDILSQLALEKKVRGEATLIVTGAVGDEDPGEVRDMASEDIRSMLSQGLDSRTILERVMATYSLSRRVAYNLILVTRDAGGLEEED